MTVTVEQDVMKRSIFIYVHTGDGNDTVKVDLGMWMYQMAGVEVDLGAGDDEATNLDNYPIRFFGREGDDVLRGGPAWEYLEGGEGVDKLYGGAGNDTLHAGFIEVHNLGPGRPSGLAPTEPGEVYDPGTGRDLVVTAEGEDRYLDGEPAEEEPPAPMPMMMSFAGRSMVRKGAQYTFSVTYSAPGDTIRLETAGDDDLVVTGPAGFSSPATLLRARPRAHGWALVARYRVAAPGGTFDATDNGRYTIAAGDGAVASVSGRSAGAAAAAQGFGAGARAQGEAAGTIGGFTVAARPRRGNRNAPPAAPALSAAPCSRRTAKRDAGDRALADLLA